MDYAEVFKGMKLAKSYKGTENNNPIFEQHYGADPYALVYGDTVYFYMTADAYERDDAGEIKENTYSKILSEYYLKLIIRTHGPGRTKQNMASGAHFSLLLF